MAVATLTRSRRSYLKASKSNRYKQPAREIQLCVPVFRLMGFCSALFMKMVFFSFLLLGISAGFMALYWLVTTHPYFGLQDITIRGNAVLSTEEIQRLSKVNRGQNTLGISMSSVRDNVRTNPWVESVRVRRVIPNALVIDVKEKEPVFWVKRDNNLYYAQANGIFISPVDTARSIFLPVLFLERWSPEIGVSIENLSVILKENKLPFGHNQCSWIRIEDDQATLGLRRLPVEIEFNLTELDSVVPRLGLVWNDLEKRNELSKTGRIRFMETKAFVEKIDSGQGKESRHTITY